MENHSENCIVCQEFVRPRQEAVQCDGCHQWCHRKCNTGITRQDYRAAVQAGEIDWSCDSCSAPKFPPPTFHSSFVECAHQLPPNSGASLEMSSIYEPVYSIESSESSILDQAVAQSIDRGSELPPPVSPVQPAPSLEESSVLDQAVAQSIDRSSELPPPVSPVQLAQSLEESSILDPAPTTANSSFQPLPWTFEIIEDSTKRGMHKLVDNLGYTYNIKRRRGSTTDWQCTVRPKNNPCKATVMQRANGDFAQGSHPHNHSGQVGAERAAKITSRLKKEAATNLFKPAQAIVDEILLEELTDAPCPSLPKAVNLARAANLHRQRLRPTDPTDIDFDLDGDHIPDGFLRRDIKERRRRHLIFASDQQLQQLSSAKSWYIDGTFKLCRHPFSQLLTINAFVRKDDCAKQVPLVFVLMSGRTKKDYKKVLKAVLDVLPSEPRVKQVTLDFEQAVWTVIRELLPGVKIMGCVFHWTQALWRKVQQLGLQQDYCDDRGTYLYVRKLMALPFLPETEIACMFTRLQGEANNAPLQMFAAYIECTWIRGSWSPTDWCVYKQSVCTNNNVEGWHHGLHRCASGRQQLPLYLLINLLHREAQLTALNIRLVSERKLKRIQRKKYRQLQTRIFDLWEEYENNNKTARQLLKACSYLNGPLARH